MNKRRPLMGLFAIATLGCGGRVVFEESSGAGTGGGSTSIGATTTAAQGTGGDAPTKVGVGLINVGPGAAGAWFYRNNEWPVAGCDSNDQHVDGCRFDDCPEGDHVLTPISAGTIHVTGTSVPVTLSPKADGTYAQFMFSGSPFQGGDTLTFTSDGGADVPMFHGTLVVPPPVVVTAPMSDITLADGFSVSWTPVSVGKVFVQLDEQKYDSTNKVTHNLALICGFPAAQGSGTVSPNALALLYAEPNVTLGVGVANETTVDAGSWSIRLGIGQSNNTFYVTLH